MKFTPYPCQRLAIEHAVRFLSSAAPQQKQLYSGPTGVGKSVVELAVQRIMGHDKCAIVTPRTEIIDGMLDKLEAPEDADPRDYNIWTPITLRNRLLEGAVRHPQYVIFDETHHGPAHSWQQLGLLTGFAPAVGYTASPYRGSPRSTAKFREEWGEPLPIITYSEAIAAGYIAFPEMSILPLVDDDIVDVSGGEFEVTSLEAATVDRLGDLADHSKRWYDNAANRWDLPTIFALPSTKLAEQFHRELAKRHLPAAVVSCHHPRNQRPLAFAAVENGILALIHVNVVQEGVDLKLRRLVDMSPCMSPVKWVQQIGRIMRPWDRSPQYICCNRNVLRHAYILEGVVPSSAVADTERMFGPTSRAHSRVLGLEAIGRFRPSWVSLRDGTKLYVYNLQALIGNVTVEYCCLVHPSRDPIWAAKANTVKDGEKTWGSWYRCEPPIELRGFASKSSKQPTDKQMGWWRKQAAYYGLDHDFEPDKKSFVALPVLHDLGEHL